MSKISKWLLPILILIYTAFNSKELINAWINAPLDWLGWLPFTVWLLPLCFVGRSNIHYPFLWIAVIFSLLGDMSSLNALRYLGFSSAIAAWAPLSWGTVVWWISSVAWMPAFGWFGSRLFPENVLTARFLVVALSIVCFIFANKKERSKTNA